MKNFFIILVVFISIAFLLTSSCHKSTPCGPVRKDTSFISDIDKSIVHYQLNDIVNFKHSNGQTYSYKVHNIDSGFDYAKEPSDGCSDAHYLQFKRWSLWKFGTTNTQWDITIQVFFNYGASTHAPLFDVYYQNYSYEDLAYWIPSVPSPAFIDSMNINGYEYYFIRKIFYHGYSSSPDYIFYNRQFGILKIVAGTETFERIP